MKIPPPISSVPYGEIIRWDATAFLTLHDGYPSRVYHGRHQPTSAQDAGLWLRSVGGGLARFAQALARSVLRGRAERPAVPRPYLLLIATGTAKYAGEEREVAAACAKRGLGLVRIYPGKGIGFAPGEPTLSLDSALRFGDHACALGNWLGIVLRGTRHMVSRDSKRRSLFAASIFSARLYCAHAAVVRRIVAAAGLPQAVLSLCPSAGISVAIVDRLKSAGVATAGIRTQTTSRHAEHLAINVDVLFCKSRHERAVYEELFAGQGPRLENACLLSLPEDFSLAPLPLPEKFALVLGTAPASGQSAESYFDFNDRLFQVAEAAGLPLVFKGHGMAAGLDEVWFAQGRAARARCLRVADVRRNRELVERAALVVSAATTLLYHALLRKTPTVLVQSPTDSAIPDEFRGAPLARIAPEMEAHSFRIDWPSLRDSAEQARAWFEDNYFLARGPDVLLDALLEKSARTTEPRGSAKETGLASPRNNCLFLATDFPPPLVGGALVYYHYLLSAPQAFRLVAVTRRKENSREFDAALPCAVLRTRCLPAHGASRVGGLLRYVWLIPMLLVWLRRYRAPVLHLASLKTILPGWLASRIAGRKLVVSVFGEDLASLQKRTGWLRRIQCNATIAALRRSERMLTIASFGKETLRKIGIPEERIEVITPGIDVAKTPETLHVDPAIAARLAGKRILLTVGRLVPRKGQEMVLRTMPELVGAFPELHYVVAAGGLHAEAGKERCEKLAAELGVRDHVSVFANLDNAAVAWLYRECEIFIMANRNMPNGDTEGYGIVFLEAGAWGKPVIGGRAGGVVDAVDDGETGILVDGTRTDDIAQAIRRLLADGVLAKRMGEAGRAKVLRNGWDSKAEQYFRMIDRLAEAK